MAVIDSLKLNDGTILYPKTLTSAIYNDGGTERLDNVLAKAQLFKLTSDSGLVHQTIPWAVSSLNGITTAGLYNISGLSGGPKTSSYGVLEVIKRNNSVIFQKFYDSAPVGVESYERKSYDGGLTWGSWDMIALMNNAMVDHGNNANGRFIKFGDGTMICYAKFMETSISPAITEKVMTWAYPHAFIDRTVAVTGTFYCIHQTVSFRKGIFLRDTADAMATSTNFVGRDIDKGTFDEFAFEVIAIGKWK